MEGAAPRSVNYADTLPLAISSTQNRRSYYPQNGQNFTDTGSNIIRIDVNADGLLNVLDVVALVNIIIESDDYILAGDMNQDGALDVLDIVALVNIILN